MQDEQHRQLGTPGGRKGPLGLDPLGIRRTDALAQNIFEDRLIDFVQRWQRLRSQQPVDLLLCRARDRSRWALELLAMGRPDSFGIIQGPAARRDIHCPSCGGQ